MVVFTEVIWVKGFFVVCAVGLPSCVCLCGWFVCVGWMKCFKHLVKNIFVHSVSFSVHIKIASHFLILYGVISLSHFGSCVEKIGDTEKMSFDKWGCLIPRSS